METAMDTTPDHKSQPYTFDLGHMLCNDPNPLPSHTSTTKEQIIQSTAKDCAQALISQLLSTCPITRSESDGALQITLPPPEFHLPREKPVPKEKEKTKWEKFAEKKGIKGKRKDGKLEFNERKGEWVPKYGYKGKKGDAVGDDWLVEVDEKGEEQGATEGKKDSRGNGDMQRREKKMKARKAK